jgi:hypothetical protein
MKNKNCAYRDVTLVNGKENGWCLVSAGLGLVSGQNNNFSTAAWKRWRLKAGNRFFDGMAEKD